MNILMHTCCSTCALYPVSFLRSKGEQVTGFWFNPNIHPYLEYRSRLDSVRKLEDLLRLEVMYEDRYGLVMFVRAVVGKEQDRCKTCYFLRLKETARKARDHGFDAFTTSLLISPYQNQCLIRDLGDFFSKQYNVEFLFHDFRDGFRSARRQAAELGLYRQKYCGCIYSEQDRFMKASHSNKIGEMVTESSPTSRPGTP